MLGAEAATAALPSSGARNLPRTFQCDALALVEVRVRLQSGDSQLAEAAATIRQDADKYLRQEPLSIVGKPWTPPSGDKHDYMSLAPYFWPDPNKPNGIPYKRKDGQTNPQRDEFDEPKMVKLCRSVRTLGLAWWVSGDERYAAKAAGLLRTWFLDPATRMNPNVNFGQFVPGVTNGRAEGILETRGLMQVVDTIGLLGHSASWTKQDQQGLEQWFRLYLQWMMTSPIGQEEMAAENNHGNWFDAQAATYAMFVGDEKTAKQIVGNSLAHRVSKQIQPDGKQPFELARTKAFDYCVFSLEALSAVATIGELVGEDLWNERAASGGSIRGAIDWLLPYATGEQSWPFEQIKKPKTGKLYELVRRAAIAYREPKYDALVSKFQADDADAEFVNLLYPAFRVTAPPSSAKPSSASAGAKPKPGKTKKPVRSSKPSMN